MKPSQTREQREHAQAARGDAARRLIEDEGVSAWFENRRGHLVDEMLKAAVNDDAARRAAALQIRALDDLTSHLRTQATLGRKAAEEIGKRIK